jgi:hypothetical protein
VHFTPTSASWLNLVERWFATLTEKQIKRGAHRSTRALEAAIREYLTISNGSATPFVWTNTLMKSSPRSPDFVSESLTRDTRNGRTNLDPFSGVERLPWPGDDLFPVELVKTV